MRLTNNSGDSYSPDIAVKGANIYVVWTDRTPGNPEIYFNKSTDGGATWQTAKRLTFNAGNSWGPSIAVDGLNVYVVWYDDSPGNMEVYFKKSTDGGTTWQTAKRLTNTTGDSYDPRITVSGSNIFVVFTKATEGNYIICLMKSTNSGATWPNIQELTDDTRQSFEPDIAVSGLSVFIVWYYCPLADPDNHVVIFKKSNNGGSTWPITKTLRSNAASIFNPRIAIHSPNIYVVWADFIQGGSTAQDICFRKSTDGGANWQSAKRIVNNPDSSTGPDIAVSGSNIYVVRVDYVPGNDEIDDEVYLKKSTDAGATWPTWPYSQKLTNNAGDSSQPSIAVNASNVYVVYCDDTPGNFEIYLKYSPL
jgi:hypothetical protein